MSYGLYDADLKLYFTPFYNLELMKLSSYYKNKREIVGLSPDFSPSRYTNFIVRQDFYNPHQIYKGTNVTYGGRAIDGKKYKPLPLEIEMMQPDISLYSNVKLITMNKEPKVILNTMRRAEHIRLSLDGKTVWSDFEKQFRKDRNCFGVIFHDYNLNEIEGAFELIRDNINSWINISNGRRIGTKFPIEVYNEDDLCKWLSLKPMGHYFSLCHNGLITKNYQYLSELRKKSTTIPQSSMNINNEIKQNQFQRIFRTIINLRSYRVVFRLKYDEASFSDNNWKKVMAIINHYNNRLLNCKSDYFNRKEPYETLYGYCFRKIKSPSDKDPLINKDVIPTIFQFVRENDYELFKDFYEYRGGEVRNDR